MVSEKAVGCSDPQANGAWGQKREVKSRCIRRADTRGGLASPWMQTFQAGSPQGGPDSSRSLLTRSGLIPFSSFLCIIKQPPRAGHCARRQSSDGEYNRHSPQPGGESKMKQRATHNHTSCPEGWCRRLAKCTGAGARLPGLPLMDKWLGAMLLPVSDPQFPLCKMWIITARILKVVGRIK